MSETKLVIDCSDPDAVPVEVPLSEAELDQRASDQAAHGAVQAVAAFAVSEDAERLALVAERAQADPAFAALAELALGGKGL
jgi:hypothetical protein